MRAFDERVESELRPAMEQRYAAAVAAGNATAADAELAAFTAAVVAEAGALLDQQALLASTALKLDGLPGDNRMERWLYNAVSEYSFDFDSSTPAPLAPTLVGTVDLSPGGLSTWYDGDQAGDGTTDTTGTTEEDW